MKRLIAAAALVVLLAGCAGGDADDTDVKTTVVDGITCVVMDGYNSGGISCDWGDR